MGKNLKGKECGKGICQRKDGLYFARFYAKNGTRQNGYFKTLPKGFEEAAYIDGCGYWKTMVKIMVPMAKPSIITVILFNFLSFWNEYIIAYTLMDGHDTLAMGLKNLMAVEKTATNYGIMYAGLVIVMLPTLILYIAVQKRLTEGMTLGGLKG